VVVAGDRTKSPEGVLERLDAAGAPETQGALFIPMHRIVEVVDLGQPRRF